MSKTTGDPFGDAKNDAPEPTPGDAANQNRSLLASMVQSRADRFKGAEAASIGLVLAGCIALGFFIGQWLDAKFGTTYWMPIGLLMGVAAGFRELFHTIRRLNDQNVRDAVEKKRSSAPQNSSSGEDFRRPKGAALEKEPESEVGTTRLFSVPAPPTASFEKSKNEVSKSTQQTKPRAESLEELTQRLLKEEKNDEQP